MEYGVTAKNYITASNYITALRFYGFYYLRFFITAITAHAVTVVIILPAPISPPLAYFVSISSWKVQEARTLHQKMQRWSGWNFSIILISYKSPISFVFNLVFRWFNSKFYLLYWAILLFCFWIKIQIKIFIKLLPK